MESVYLYDMDSLQSVAEQSLALRRQQIAAAETIIAGHVTDFVKRFLSGYSSDLDAGKTDSPVGGVPLRVSGS